jgi:hypothetical protein
LRGAACILFAVLVMFSCGCGKVAAPDRWNHFSFSAAAASVCTATTSKPSQSVCAVAALGLLKEIYDGLYGTGFDLTDLAAGVLGSTAGGFAAASICMEEFP